jgi:hypothetical protein
MSFFQKKKKKKKPNELQFKIVLLLHLSYIFLKFFTEYDGNSNEVVL